MTVVGAGRAGSAFATLLDSSGWPIDLVHHDEDLVERTSKADLVLLCVPDSAVAEVSGILPISEERVVAHCAGSLTLDVLQPHPKRASMHPLMSIPPPPLGAGRMAGAWFAVAGEPLADDLVAAIGGRSFRVTDTDRGKYHAASAIASNHLVALLGQVERIADQIGVPMEAYLELVRASADNVGELGAAGALTGPVARGDWDTVRQHIESIAESERATYQAMAVETAKLAGSRDDSNT